jgi:LEA14-like dessication related protein
LLAAACTTLTPRPSPLSVVLEGVRVVRVTPADTRLGIALSVHNPNPFDIAVAQVEATLNLENDALLTGTLVAPVRLLAGSDTRVEIETRTDFLAIANAIERLTRQRDLRYDVIGSATMEDGRRLPFTRRGELPAAAWLKR